MFFFFQNFVCRGQKNIILLRFNNAIRPPMLIRFQQVKYNIIVRVAALLLPVSKI